MAGIGFNLRALSQHHSILVPFLSLGHATWISSGPLVLTAICFVAIQAVARDSTPAAELMLFRTVLTYSSMIALITACPVGLIVTKLVADSIYKARFGRIPALLTGGLICAAILAGNMGLVIWNVFTALPAVDAISAWILTQSFALLWISTIVSGTLKDYRGVTSGFVAGILMGFIIAVLLGERELSTHSMMWSVTTANMATVTWLYASILFAFPARAGNSVAAALIIVRSLGKHPFLSVGALAAALGVWVDKWIMWSSELGRTVSPGLAYAPIYDTAMFFSFLIIVPALAAFIIHIETNLQVHVARFLGRILKQGTLDEIENAAGNIGTVFRSSLLHLFVVQAAITACTIMSLPLIVSSLGLHFAQIPVLRLGLLGSLFHLLFLICSSVLLFVNRPMSYCLLQLAFLITNGLATWVCLRLGVDFTGLGYFASAMICALAAYFWLDRTLRHLVHLTFAGVRPYPAPRAYASIGSRRIRSSAGFRDARENGSDGREAAAQRTG
jgi:uncharacterized membrane protein